MQNNKEGHLMISSKAVVESITQQVYNYVTDMILIGNILPGQRLSDREIAKELDVSRTPVREALIRLERHGLISTIPRRGSFVTSLSAEDIKEIYNIRILLEGFAIERAVELATPDFVAYLESCLHEYEQNAEEEDDQGCVRTDFEFHLTIMRQSGYFRVIDIMESYNLLLLGISMRSPSFRQETARYIQEHGKILESIRKRDSVTAADRLRKHIASGRDELLETYS